MMRNFSTVILLFLSFFAASCSSSVADKSANAPEGQANANSQATNVKALPADVLQASASAVEVQAGKSAQAEVRLTIKEGYHINANPPSQYQIATQLTVEPADGVTAGQPTYPASITKKFAFSEQPLAVYEKDATINVPLNAAAGAAKGARTISARVRFQACDEQVCYPKRDLQVLIPLTVK